MKESPYIGAANLHFEKSVQCNGCVIRRIHHGDKALALIDGERVALCVFQCHWGILRGFAPGDFFIFAVAAPIALAAADGIDHDVVFGIARICILAENDDHIFKGELLARIGIHMGFTEFRAQIFSGFFVIIEAGILEGGIFGGDIFCIARTRRYLAVMREKERGGIAVAQLLAEAFLLNGICKLFARGDQGVLHCHAHGATVFIAIEGV